MCKQREMLIILYERSVEEIPSFYYLSKTKRKQKPNKAKKHFKMRLNTHHSKHTFKETEGRSSLREREFLDTILS